MKDVLSLTLIALVSFSLFSSGMGFYIDDWTILEQMSSAGGFWKSILTLLLEGSSPRPVNALQFGIFFAVAGFNPAYHQLLLLALDVISGVLFFLLLKGLLGRRDLAFAAAALAMIYPVRAATHHWFTNSAQGAALGLALGSMILHQRWLKAGGAALLCASLCGYLLSILCYESVAFLPVMLAGAMLAERWHSGRKFSQGLLQAGKDMAPYGLALSTVLLWQWVGTRWFLSRNPKTLGFSLGHTLDVFGGGLRSLTTDSLDLCLLTLRPALHDFDPSLKSLWLASVAASVFLFRPRDEAAPGERKRSLAAAAGAAAAGFAAAYAPYALSPVYVPNVHGINSRTNGVGALIGGVVLAALAEGILLWAPKGFERPARAARLLLLAAVVGAFTWTNWEIALQWNRAWSMQQEIMAKLARKVERLPGPAMILLSGTPHRINGVPVFSENWDFSSALRLVLGRKDLEGTVLYRDYEAGDGRVIDRVRGGREYAHPHLFIYHYDRDALEAVAQRAAK